MRKPLCNGKPETAPHICGCTFLLCWRCTGAVCGLIVFFLFEKIFLDNCSSLFICFLCIPAVVDFYLNKYELKKPNNMLRFFTGVLLGMSFGCVEILLVNCLL